jgi:hypothetical protein
MKSIQTSAKEYTFIVYTGFFKFETKYKQLHLITYHFSRAWFRGNIAKPPA